MGTTTANLALYKPATSDVVNVVTDINNNMDTIDTAIQSLRVPPKGKLWRTGGFFGLPAVAVDIDFEASRALNGMTVTAGSQGLVVPTSGLYRVYAYGYSSGGGAPPYDTQYTAYRIRAAVANKILVYLYIPKLSAADTAASGTTEVPLAAGDEIRMTGSSTGGAVSTWGVDEASGVRLELEYVGPLSGATPI